MTAQTKAEMERFAKECINGEPTRVPSRRERELGHMVLELLAAPASGAEAVAWRFKFPTVTRWHYTEHGPHSRSREELTWEPLYAAAPACAAEPDAWIYRAKGCPQDPWTATVGKPPEQFYEVRPLFSAPPDFQAGLEAAAKEIPTSWLDPLLSGPDAAIKSDHSIGLEIEALLTKLRARILALAARKEG